MHMLPGAVQAQNRKHKSTFIPRLFAHCRLKGDLCFRRGILKLAYDCDDGTPVFIKGNSGCATMGRNITCFKQHCDTSSQCKMSGIGQCAIIGKLPISECRTPCLLCRFDTWDQWSRFCRLLHMHGNDNRRRRQNELDNHCRFEYQQHSFYRRDCVSDYLRFLQSPHTMHYQFESWASQQTYGMDIPLRLTKQTQLIFRHHMIRHS